ncbi:MAG: aspartate carbamoyltransferase [Bordetella sp.]|nr:MAG: aspartate carbamoyltransferase [Bordetella sp.]
MSISKILLRDQISFNGKYQLLSIDQFTRDSVEQLFKIADILQPVAQRKKISKILDGAVLGNLFFEASTRTRVSFGSAFCRLGGSVCDTTGFTFSSMAKGESIYDTSRVMSGYVDIMVIRHPEKGSVKEFSRVTDIPIINGGDGSGEHPSQALLDLYTIKTEFSNLGKKLDGAHIAIVGDLKNGRTVHSLVKLLSFYKGLKISLISPVGMEIPNSVLEDSSYRNNNIFEFKKNLSEGLVNADIVYATRVQRERDDALENCKGYTSDFRINKEIINLYCKNDVVIMHPLPRDSRHGANDLSTDLDNDPRLAIFRQTDNGISIRMAIFVILMGLDDLVYNSLIHAEWQVRQNKNLNFI